MLKAPTFLPGSSLITPRISNGGADEDAVADAQRSRDQLGAPTPLSNVCESRRTRASACHRAEIWIDGPQLDHLRARSVRPRPDHRRHLHRVDDFGDLPDCRSRCTAASTCSLNGRSLVDHEVGAGQRPRFTRERRPHALNDRADGHDRRHADGECR